MNNILTAIMVIVGKSSITVDDSADSHSLNRATQMGDALENYVKNAFADCLGQDSKSVKLAHHRVFSYLGNSRNPPDAMLRGSDAIEIKKLASLESSQLQLNSSYPKNKLYSDNPKICQACRDCEEWEEKDMLYVVGHVDGQELKNIFFVYGDLYCDSRDIYERVENVIKEGLQSLEDVELAETNELGRLNSVDHLGISDLRIRGMWLINSPFQHFSDLTKDMDQEDHTFKLFALIPKEKYDSFSNVEEFEIFCKEKNVNISDEDIKDPKNPAMLLSAKLITYYIN